MRRESSLSVRSNGDSLADGRLESWKGIAVYLKREIRTVQRWEKEEKLPVHRHLHRSQGTVYAYKSELDSWLAQRQPESEMKRRAPARMMLAVLPFENLSADPTQDYFSDGLTEEMIARLADLSRTRWASSRGPRCGRTKTKKKPSRRSAANWVWIM